MLLLLIFYASTVIAQLSENCANSGTGLYHWPAVQVWFVRYPCNSATPRIFCGEESGWGNEEATVVCREQGFIHGTGRIVKIARPNEFGYSSLYCNSTERALSECSIGALSSQPCQYIAVITKCTNVPQVYVKGLLYSETFGHHLVAEDEGQRLTLCLEILGANTLITPISISVITTRSFISPKATAYSDYIPLNETVVFEASSMMMSERCVEIEIVDDSLTEPWEVFSVLISTTSSAVEIVDSIIDVYIHPNTGVSATIPSSKNTVPSSGLRPGTPSLETATILLSSSSITPQSSSLLFLTGSSFTSGVIHKTLPVMPLVSSLTVIAPIITSNVGVHETSVPYPNRDAVFIITAPSPVSSQPPSSTMQQSRTSTLALVGGITAAVAVILGLTLALVLVSLTLCLKEKTSKKHTVPVVPTPAPKVTRPTAETNAVNERRLSLTNPTYQPNTPEETQAVTPEHNFKNPLYDTGSERTDYCSGGPHNAVYEFVP